MTARPLDANERAAWERALAVWGVQLHAPLMLPEGGLGVGAPAWFGFPPEVSVDPSMVARYGATAELESVFAHEVGHHVLAPSTRIDSLAIRHQIARALQASGFAVSDARVSMLANLWNDLLVNTRLAALQRARDGDTAQEPGIVRACRLLFEAPSASDDPLWWVYLRVYELAWGLAPGTLCSALPPIEPEPAPSASASDTDGASRRGTRDREKALQAAIAQTRAAEQRLRALLRSHPEADAVAISRLLRTFADDPVSGALRFGLLAAGYVDDRSDDASAGTGAGRARRANGGAGPGAGCANEGPPTPGELGRVLADPRLRERIPERGELLKEPAESVRVENDDDPRAVAARRQSLGLAETLALYTGVDPAAVIAAWYRTEARPWVRPLRGRAESTSADELVGPIEQWDLGDDIAEIDWSSTMQASAVVVPGVTTRRRSVLADTAAVPDAPVELDLYIDSSGSMTDPRSGSPAVLAATILALSVLRGGGRVRATSFSGPDEVAGTSGFVRNGDELSAALAHYFGNATSFPLDLFAQRYARARPGDGKVRHLVVLSDDGLSSMFGAGNEAYANVAAAVRPVLTTATLVLQASWGGVDEAAAAAGYDVIEIASMMQAPETCARLAEAIRSASGVHGARRTA